MNDLSNFYQRLVNLKSKKPELTHDVNGCLQRVIILECGVLTEEEGLLMVEYIRNFLESN